MSDNIDRSKPQPLYVETLEERMMLSTVQIFASGSEGGENMVLEIDDVQVQDWFVNSGADEGVFQTFTYESDQTLTANQVSIRFTNDVYTPPLDRNLRVDAIEIDGVRFESEASNVYSDGTWLPDDGLVGGYGRGEYLNSNGAFQYSGGGGNGGSNVTVNVAGSTGQEQFNLIIEDEVVGTYTAATSQRGINYQAAGSVSESDVRIEFTNDFYDPTNGIDRNLIVDNIVIDGETFETESITTFSTGTWLSQDGISPGYGRGETLHTNGHFQFGVSGTTGSVLTVTARGEMGDEIFSVQIDRREVARFDASSQTADFVVQTDHPISENRVSIHFLNEVWDPANGIDRNLVVDKISIDGQVFQTEASNVLSTGTWLAQDGIASGFGRGETLHALGYFQFGGEVARNTLSVDPVFGGSNGVAATSPSLGENIGGYGSGAGHSYQLANGKMIVARAASVQRMNADGSIDSSFGNNGSFDISTLNDGLNRPIHDIEVFADGSVLVIGEVNPRYPSQTDNNVLMYKLMADGQLDTSFANGAISSELIGKTSNDFTRLSPDAAIDGDGNVILAGGARDSRGLAILRFNSNGQIDSSFGGSIANEAVLNGDVGQIAIRPNGSFLVNVSGNDAIGDFGTAAVVKLNSNGQLDTSFGQNGVARSPRPNDSLPIDFSDGFGNMVVDSQGRAVLGGGGAMLRFTTSGQVDTSFGIDGIAEAPLTTLFFADGFEARIGGFQDLEIDSQDRLYMVSGIHGPIIGARPVTFDTPRGSLVYQFSADGILNRSAGDNGRLVATGIFSNSASLDASDRLVFVGVTTDTGENPAVGRFLV